jgi:hypothetical protein
VAGEMVRPEKIEGHVAYCPCGALVEIPRLASAESVRALPKEMRARLSITTVNGGTPEVSTIRCVECICVLDLRAPA